MRMTDLGGAGLRAIHIVMNRHLWYMFWVVAFYLCGSIRKLSVWSNTCKDYCVKISCLATLNHVKKGDQTCGCVNSVALDD